jgi:hypothetical protein
MSYQRVPFDSYKSRSSERKLLLVIFPLTALAFLTALVNLVNTLVSTENEPYPFPGNNHQMFTR